MSPRIWFSICMVSWAAQAGVNKCVHPDGRVTYSDKPCPGGDQRGDIKGHINSYSSGESTSHMQGYLGASAAAHPKSRPPPDEPSGSSAPAAASPPPPPARSSGHGY